MNELQWKETSLMDSESITFFSIIEVCIYTGVYRMESPC